MARLHSGSSGILILFAITGLIWFGVPVAALLGELGLLHSELRFKPGQIVQQNGILRVKKTTLPKFGRADLRHAYVLQNGVRHEKRPSVSSLHAAGAAGSFLLGEQSLYIRPFSPLPAGTRPTGYSLARIWTPAAWLWALWGALSLLSVAMLWRGKLWPELAKEFQRLSGNIEKFTGRKQLVPWHLFAYTMLTTACIAAANWAKLSNPYLVAEDGRIFLEGQLAYGLGAAVHPYAGYLHLLPRVLAWAAGMVPLEHQATALVWSSLALMMVTIYFIGCWTTGAERVAVAAFLTLAPMGGYLMFSPTNLQWFTGLALVLLAAHPSPEPAGWSRKILLLVAATVAALTGPFAVVTLPAFLWRAWRHHASFDWQLLATQGFSVAIQVIMLTLPSSEAPSPSTMRGAVLPWLADFSLGLFGKAVTLSPEQSQLWGGILAILVATPFVGALLLWKGTGGARMRILWLLGFAVLFAAAGWARSDGSSRSWQGGERYYVIPYALVVVAMVALLSSRQRLITVIVPALLAIMTFGLHRTEPPHVHPPSWPEMTRSIPAGGHGWIETYPPGRKWSVLVARGTDDAPLRGPQFRAVKAGLDDREPLFPSRPPQR